VTSLNSLETVSLYWYYTPALYGKYIIYVRTELSTDDYNGNNASTEYMNVPLLLSKLVTMTGVGSNDLFGFNVTSGYLNIDAYRDIIVGAPGANTTYVFYGSGSAGGSLRATDADVILAGPDPDSGFGWSVGVSDVTGDGFDDIIVGAPKYNGSQGRVYIYHSSATGLEDANADVIITGGSPGDRFGNSVAGGFDMDGAESEDVIIGAYLNDTLYGNRADAGMAYVFFGGIDMMGDLGAMDADLNLSGISEGDHFGFAVSSALDVNNDGYDDIVIGAPGASEAYIYYGGDGLGVGGYRVSLFTDGFESGDFDYGGWVLSSPPPVVSMAHPRTGSYAAGGSVGIFGPNINTYTFAKNVDTIGHEDIIVSYYVAVEDAGPGSISFVASYSTDGGESWTDFEGPITDTNNIYVGKLWDLSSVTAANNNPDFTIRFAGTFGGVTQQQQNAFWVDDVDVTAAVIPGMASANVTLTGEDTGDDFGWSVAGSGNVDGDPFDDVVVGAPAYGSGTGRAYVFCGSGAMSSTISASDADVTLGGLNPGDGFGYSVAGADMGSNGYSDILVGAPYNDTLDGSVTDAGAIFVFNGSAALSGFLEAGNMTRYGENAGDHFGWSLFGAVDMNGDGSGDIIVGAPHYDSGSKTDAGKAYVLTIIPEFSQIAVPAVFVFIVFYVMRSKSRRYRNPFMGKQMQIA
jgi:hypothetical protein